MHELNCWPLSAAARTQCFRLQRASELEVDDFARLLNCTESRPASPPALAMQGRFRNMNMPGTALKLGGFTMRRTMTYRHGRCAQLFSYKASGAGLKPSVACRGP